MNRYINQIIQATNLSEQQAWWLLEHIVQVSQAELLSQSIVLSPEQEESLQACINQIVHEHKPLTYILGFVPFLNLHIAVHPPILIPRHETEEWVDTLIQRLKDVTSIKKILDIGTGSGAIAIALAKHFPQAQVMAVDINPQAISLTAKNAEINGVKNITGILSDLFDNIPADEKFDLIVSNPPYIPQSASSSISRSVINWEDSKALFAGDIGMDIIEQIFKKSFDYIRHNSNMPFQLVVEIDQSQQHVVSKLAQENNIVCTVEKDLFGNVRTAWCKKE